MFLVDDLLMSPVKGVFWVLREIHNAARQELEGEGAAITAALSELYMKLETGELTESEFDAQEKALLNRLDRLQAADRKPEQQPSSRPRKSRKREKLPPAAKPAMLL